ncbi:MgtC/SapB family protein [Marinihelvus fidelis]|uniref:Protein MgtC n=1 Tax=Marinihelvus fidelis TaxID=2613842 RepID=A0A5N0T7T3_9GAMM|nr:MgtC/SapB family protein [Marinihelvus fidelis]KAA9130980.1 MgtC/SapB family protein [Marinihelvus fidelis]
MDIDWGQIFTHLAHMALAYLLAFPTAINREANASPAGVRTFPLVAVATCGYMLVGMSIMQSEEAHARLMEGLVTGMGFIGGGAILKHGGRVMGLATAAALWSTGAIGIAVAWSRYEIAIALALINFLTFSFLATPVKNALKGNGEGSGDEGQ